jgi:glycosyltransferase involved in cell wall biosynthesis
MVSLSIIIPTFNRSIQLEKTLFSLMSSKVDCSIFEVIVVDNGSKDFTKEIVDKYIKLYNNIEIRYFYDDVPGLLTGRHRGAKESKGDILTFIDDDVQVSPNWISTIIEVMINNPKISLLTGPCLPLYESIPPRWLDFFWCKETFGRSCSWLSLLDLGNELHEIDTNYVWGLNFTIRKSVFYNLKGFHPDNIPKKLQQFQGDGETGLTIKAKLYGFKAFYHPEVLLYHNVPRDRMSIEYFEKRAFYQGVCNSFTDLRMNNSLKYNNTYYNKTFTFKKITNWLIKLIRQTKKNKINSLPPSYVLEYYNILNLKQQEGYDFHQKMYFQDSLVKKWVHRQDFIDYNLPTYDREDY